MNAARGNHWRIGADGYCAVVLFLALAAALARGALPLDTNGWSVLTPSIDSHLIYVSNDTGSDTTGTLYLPSDPPIGPDPFHPVGAVAPFKTAAGAYAKTRLGYPDWILFHRGETWTTGLGGCRNGRSDTERMVVTSYGSSPERPLFKTGTSGGLNITYGGGRTAIQYFAIVGLHFYCDGRDPASPTFAGYADGPDGLSVLGTATTPGYPTQCLLYEDCQVEWYGLNLDLQGGKNTDHDVAVRRNVLNNAYNMTAHSQGCFCYLLYDITVEENVFHHNGWYGFAGSGQGDATVFNHNTYFDQVHDCTFSGNMFLSASSIGNKWVNYAGGHSYNITVDNNLYVEGEVGMSLVGNTADGLSSLTVTNNVLEGIGRTRPTGRTLSWGLDINTVNGGLIQNNYIIRQDAPVVNNTYAISVSGTTNRNVTITKNTIYQLLSNGAMIQLADNSAYSGIVFANNVINENAYTPQIVNAAGTLAPFTFRNNLYWTAKARAQWFQVATANKSLAQWVALSGETGATTGTLPYFDPTRTVETYNATQGGPGNFGDFVAQSKLQSKTNWRTAYTAAAVNTYIRGGFDQPPVGLSDSFSTNEDVPLAQNAPGVLANDTDADLDTLTASLVTSATHGAVTLSADGSFTYRPATHYAGPDRFVYRAYDGVAYSGATTVTLTVNAVAPPATNSASGFSLY